MNVLRRLRYNHVVVLIAYGTFLSGGMCAMETIRLNKRYNHLLIETFRVPDEDE